jgi:hypothetical protein
MQSPDVPSWRILAGSEGEPGGFGLIGGGCERQSCRMGCSKAVVPPPAKLLVPHRPADVRFWLANASTRARWKQARMPEKGVRSDRGAPTVSSCEVSAGYDGQRHPALRGLHVLIGATSLCPERNHSRAIS